jgi:DNA-binding response OmpR family regulator
MLVHTDADIRDELAAALRQAGYDALEFANTLPGISALEGKKKPDLLITRSKYPAGSPTGLSLARIAMLRCQKRSRW